MADGERSTWRLRSGHYLGEISALSILPLPSRLSSYPLLLAGTGSQILIYDMESGNLLNSFTVFQGVRVHGISLRSPDPTEDSLSVVAAGFLIAVFGERRVKLFLLRIDAGSKRSGRARSGRLPGVSLPVASVETYSSKETPSEKKRGENLSRWKSPRGRRFAQSLFPWKKGGSAQIDSSLLVLVLALAAQHREIQALLLDNQRLASTHVGLKQEISTCQNELRRRRRSSPICHSHSLGGTNRYFCPRAWRRSRNKLLLLLRRKEESKQREKGGRKGVWVGTAIDGDGYMQ